MSENDLMKTLPPLIGLAFLIFILLFVLATFGYIRPCDVPGFSDAYYAVKGSPRIALISGADGTGNPDKLESIISDLTGKFVDRRSLSDIETAGVLTPYQLVIVDHARTIDTQTLKNLRDYAMLGGKLVWIGDAGTGLGESDYICEAPSFRYIVQLPVSYGNETKLQCQNAMTVSGEDASEPKELKAGICGRDFGEVVMNYLKFNETLYTRLNVGSVSLCQDPTYGENYIVENNDRIGKCLKKLSGKEVTRETVNELCTFNPEQYATADNLNQGINYWNRGNSYSETGDVISGIDFGSVVLGMRYVASIGTQSLNLKAINTEHPLSNGYSEGVNLYGSTNYSIISVDGFSYRATAVMNLIVGNQAGANQRSFPAVLTTNPTGPSGVTGRGLVVYYAFPPEDLIEINEKGQYEGATNMIVSMIKYAVC